MEPPFASSYLKIQRAKQHITDLNRQIAAFRDRNPYRLVIELDPNIPGQCNGVIRVREKQPSGVAQPAPPRRRASEDG
jgi:hypothetical protein